jgi:HME family heavy-metal exporter
VPGIAEVLVMGGDRKQYQVLVDPNALLEFDVTLQHVEQAVKDNNLNASGGFTFEGQTERPIRVLGRLGPLTQKVVDDLKKVPVKTHSHRNVLLSQVARIEEGPEPKRGDGGIDGSPGVVITIVKQPHTDTRSLTDNLKKVLRATEDALSADHVINTDLFQLRTFIDRGIYYVGEALVIGAVLVVIILFLFLLNFRTTFITLTAIPLSLVVTTLVFRLIGMLTGRELSINVMTLGGIAVALGELVDDAIVDVENIYRRLKENNTLAQPRPALVVVYEASKEIRSAIVFGTMVVILVFLPLFALSGVEGRLFTPLGIAYIVSILASLLVSLTVTPVLSYFLLPQSKAAHRERDSFLLQSLKWCADWKPCIWLASLASSSNPATSTVPDNRVVGHKSRMPVPLPILYSTRRTIHAQRHSAPTQQPATSSAFVTLRWSGKGCLAQSVDAPGGRCAFGIGETPRRVDRLRLGGPEYRPGSLLLSNHFSGPKSYPAGQWRRGR